MPTQQYYRFWCSKCQEFTIQHRGEEGACTICGTVTKEYKLSEVPEDKIEAQRKRYNESRLSKYENYMKAAFGPGRNILRELFEEMPVGIQQSDIIEDDAGQKEINQARFEERSRQEAIRRESHKEYTLHYKHLGRNEKCYCGSGNKYKKCCADKYRFF